MRVLFVGDTGRGLALRALAEEHGAGFWVAGETEEALGLYLLHMPDAIVIEDGELGGVAVEVHFHLASVGARPMILLSGGARKAAWESVVLPTTRVLPLDLSNLAVIEAAAEAVASLPSLFRMTGGALPRESEHGRERQR
jgi:hypothetical protein